MIWFALSSKYALLPSPNRWFNLSLMNKRRLNEKWTFIVQRTEKCFFFLWIRGGTDRLSYHHHSLVLSLSCCMLTRMLLSKFRTAPSTHTHCYQTVVSVSQRCFFHLPGYSYASSAVFIPEPIGSYMIYPDEVWWLWPLFPDNDSWLQGFPQKEDLPSCYS